jgi:uncharacterized repeat protein (TIGR03803 family)
MYNPSTGEYEQKIQFNNINNGSNPKNKLFLADNNKMYGLANNGGINNLGFFFEYDPITNVFVKIIDFDGSNGSVPYGSLVQASDGKLYGFTAAGGINDEGIIFEYDILTGTFAKRADFVASATGKYPMGTPVESADGVLYGMTDAGGISDDGVIFGFDLTTGILSKYQDLNSINVSRPLLGFMRANNDMLYGLISEGGVNNLGVLIEFDPATNTLTKKFDFDGTNSGRTPWGELFQADNDKLYGMASGGGANDVGVLFEYDLETDTYTKKFNFIEEQGNGPYGTLIQLESGKFYGVTYAGGSYGYGVLFEYDLSLEQYSKKVDFYVIDVKAPLGKLLYANNEKLYGLISQGGLNGNGSLFEYDPDSQTLTKKADFWELGITLGYYPNGGLLQAENDKLYGLARAGGEYHDGALFEYDINSEVFSYKVDFNGTNGNQPCDDLIQGSSEELFGLTSGGGVNNMGVIFKYNYNTEVLTKIFDFDGANFGSYPTGSLVLASNSKMYGLTSAGGLNDVGIIFEFDLETEIVLNKFDFETDFGINPNGSLVEVNGFLYGLATGGGANDNGVMFKYDMQTEEFIKLIDFDGLDNGAYPNTSLMLASTSKIYGITKNGGLNDQGVLFEYDPSIDVFEKKFDFDSDNGKYPVGQIIENDLFSKSNLIQSTEFSVFPNPAIKKIHVSTNENMDDVSIKITDIKGQIVFERKHVSGAEICIDINDFASGEYVIVLEQEENIVSSKFVKN